MKKEVSWYFTFSLRVSGSNFSQTLTSFGKTLIYILATDGVIIIAGPAGGAVLILMWLHTHLVTALINSIGPRN